MKYNEIVLFRPTSWLMENFVGGIKANGVASPPSFDVPSIGLVPF